jgi:hypothetical protein
MVTALVTHFNGALVAWRILIIVAVLVVGPSFPPAGWLCLAQQNKADTAPDTGIPAPADKPAEDAPDDIDFNADIRPILESHCQECHGPDKKHGGLRLDSRTGLIEGGDSQKNLLHLPLAENEFIRRLRTSEPGDRMPLEGPPLDEASINVIARWLEQDAPWPEPPRPSIAASEDDGVLVTILAAFYRHSPLATFWPAIVALVAVLVLVIALERARVTRRKQLAGGKPVSRWAERLSHVSRAWELAAVLAVALLAGYLHLSERSAAIDRLRGEVAGLRTSLDERMTHEAGRRHRPKHPPRMSGEYYRGNDERSPGLFNGGLYRTCTFRVALIDPSGKPIEWGDSLPERASLRLEIEQSPFASVSLFTSDIMGHVGLSPIRPDDIPADADDTSYTQLKPADDYADGHGKWLIERPIDLPADRARHDGMLYLYKDLRVADGKLNGECHYSVGYKLVVADGKLTRESEVWMESVFNGVSIDWIQDGMIAPNEWFDSRPIPEIVGGNTSDPNLIGIQEHKPHE